MRSQYIRRYATLTRSTSIDRSQPRPSNPRRKVREFARAYESVERVQWTKAQPCSACRVLGYSENAHVGTEGRGASRKADADQIASLCGDRIVNNVGVIGCHTLFDEHQSDFAEAFPWYDPSEQASAHEARWQRHLSNKR